MGCWGPLVAPSRTLNDCDSATEAPTIVAITMAVAMSRVMAAAQPKGASPDCQPAREKFCEPSPKPLAGLRLNNVMTWVVRGSHDAQVRVRTEACGRAPLAIVRPPRPLPAGCLHHLEPLALLHLLVHLDAVQDRRLVQGDEPGTEARPQRLELAGGGRALD